MVKKKQASKRTSRGRDGVLGARRCAGHGAITRGAWQRALAGVAVTVVGAVGGRVGHGGRVVGRGEGSCTGL